MHYLNQTDLGSDLISTLAGLNMYYFTHFDIRPVCSLLKIRKRKLFTEFAVKKSCNFTSRGGYHFWPVIWIYRTLIRDLTLKDDIMWHIFADSDNELLWNPLRWLKNWDNARKKSFFFPISKMRYATWVGVLSVNK